MCCGIYEFVFWEFDSSLLNSKTFSTFETQITKFSQPIIQQYFVDYCKKANSLENTRIRRIRINNKCNLFA